MPNYTRRPHSNSLSAKKPSENRPWSSVVVGNGSSKSSRSSSSSSGSSSSSSSSSSSDYIVLEIPTAGFLVGDIVAQLFECPFHLNTWGCRKPSRTRSSKSQACRKPRFPNAQACRSLLPPVGTLKFLQKPKPGSGCAESVPIEADGGSQVAWTSSQICHWVKALMLLQVVSTPVIFIGSYA